MTANPTSGPTAYYNVTPTLPSGYVEMSGDVTQAQLAPGQLANLDAPRLPAGDDLREPDEERQPVHGRRDRDGHAAVRSPPQNYTVTGGSGSIPSLIPNGQYTLTATTSDGMLSAASVTQSVPNDYPTDLTSTFNLDLTRPNGTLSVTATSGGTPIAGVAITVTRRAERRHAHRHDRLDAASRTSRSRARAGTPTYTVTGTYGAATFQQTGVYVTANQRRPT